MVDENLLYTNLSHCASTTKVARFFLLLCENTAAADQVFSDGIFKAIYSKKRFSVRALKIKENMILYVKNVINWP